MTEFTLNVKISASDELLEFLRRITGVTTTKAVTEKPQRTAKTEVVASTTATAAEATEPTKETAAITVEQLRAIVSEKAGKKHEIKALLKKHGAESVTLLSESNYSAFLEDLKAL